MGCFGCFDGGQKQQQRKEQERLASQEARAKAAEAAQKRQEEFDKRTSSKVADGMKLSTLCFLSTIYLYIGGIIIMCI
ncbi:hypothetical protein ACET3Z_024084 [Daucus carota]